MNFARCAGSRLSLPWPSRYTPTARRGECDMECVVEAWAESCEEERLELLPCEPFA